MVLPLAGSNVKSEVLITEWRSSTMFAWTVETSEIVMRRRQDSHTILQAQQVGVALNRSFIPRDLSAVGVKTREVDQQVTVHTANMT